MFGNGLVPHLESHGWSGLGALAALAARHDGLGQQPLQVTALALAGGVVDGRAAVRAHSVHLRASQAGAHHPRAIDELLLLLLEV